MQLPVALAIEYQILATMVQLTTDLAKQIGRVKVGQGFEAEIPGAVMVTHIGASATYRDKTGLVKVTTPKAIAIKANRVNSTSKTLTLHSELIITYQAIAVTDNRT